MRRLLSRLRLTNPVQVVFVLIAIEATIATVALIWIKL